MKIILLFIFLMLGAMTWSMPTSAGPYRVEVVTDPAVVPVGKATLIVTVTDSTGKAATGLQVKAIAQMPGMPMGEREQQAVPGSKPGEYRLPASFAMEGAYEARIAINGPLGSATAVIPLETGKSTAPGAKAAIPWTTIIVAVMVLVVGAFTIYRLKKTGQRADLKPIFSRQVLLTLGAFAVIVFGAIYVVGHFRRPGAMTPIEAQVMQMDTPPPEGVMPVTLASATVKSFNPTVRYTGQVVGYVEQTVYPRGTGVITWMPYYVGDSVKKGQVLARLDTSQLAPMLEEKVADVTSARSGIESAQADYQQAIAGVNEAEAELGQREGLVSEAQANLASAREASDAASSVVDAAQADVDSAHEMVKAAEADQDYWIEELKREENLFKAGAVSKDEYQKEQAEGAKSAAAVQQAQQQVASAIAKLNAARAGRRQADAGISAAQNRVRQAQSELMAHHAHVRTAQAAANSARQKVNQATANSGAAVASYQSASASLGYAEIRAETDGVITDRSISPGVLVNPGEAILKVAQIQPIRVQANVAEEDLRKIRVGFTVQIRHRDQDEKPVEAEVTSVSPSVDPNSRTGIVEAILPNADKTFLPGQFVTMEISTGGESNDLVVPSSAVQTEVHPTETGVLSTQEKHFVWVATPLEGQPDRYTTSRASIQLASSTEDETAIKSGISNGALVVTSSAEYFMDGQTVTATMPMAVAANGSMVTVNEQGFTPSSITVKPGQPAKITFVRTTDNTCAKEVVFPAMKLTKTLPLNEPVTIDLSGQAPGEISFACGMNMFHGKVVIR